MDERKIFSIALACVAGISLAHTAIATEKIDRYALVSRHSPSVTHIYPSSPFMVGNGKIAFTADITGLQTFNSEYSPLVPLLTQAQWAWHSFPNPGNYRFEDSLVPVDVRGSKRLYPWLKDWSEANKPAIAWLRENPHRISLGRLSFHLISRDGSEARFAGLSNTQQTLELWTGTLASSFVFDGERVSVKTRVHPDFDMIMVDVDSVLLADARLSVDLKFPGVSADLNPDPARWDSPESHQTKELRRTDRELALQRDLDDTRYFVRLASADAVTFDNPGPHTLRVVPKANARSLKLQVLFSQDRSVTPLPEASAGDVVVKEHWQRFWSQGGAIDLSGSKDPRAEELERRVVLSQYLMALNASGTVPPQEEGLFSNSWNGKFHLEMHLWHAAQFAIWGRTELLERSMPWYQQHLAEARQRASSHGVRGAWWPKMTGPEGRESPSTINPFIMWQQPHPIYLAELIYRDRQTREVLDRYRDLVFETADLLASFPHWDEEHSRYVIGPPIVPVQEVWPPLTTESPTFELEYFRFGLDVAQRWRERLGLERNPVWDRVLKALSPLPQRDGLYLATQSYPDLWQQARSDACTAPRTSSACFDRDHPSMLGALGVLPGGSVDPSTMRRTFDEVMQYWDLRQTWGWDFPFMAMTATRLHQPEKAIDILFLDLPNNRYGVAGMTPREHLIESDDPAKPPEYMRDAETYFPSNGALLLAVGLMAAGWDGNTTPLPGFPNNGQWKVRVEGLRPLP